MAGTIEAEGDLAVDHLGFGAVRITVTVTGPNPRTATRRSQACAWRPSPAPTPATALRCSPPQQATDAGQVGGGRGDLPGVRPSFLDSTGTASATWPASAPGCRTCGARRRRHLAQPLLPSPQHDHGYDVADYCGVDPVYGTSRSSTGWSRRARGSASRCCSTSSRTTAPASTPGSARRWPRPRQPGAQPIPLRRRPRPRRDEPPNNWRSMFGGPAWSRVIEPDGRPGSGTCTCSRRSSPTGTGATRRSQPTSSRCCASGWTGASTASASTSPRPLQAPRAARLRRPRGRRAHPRLRQPARLEPARGARRVAPLARHLRGVHRLDGRERLLSARCPCLDRPRARAVRPPRRTAPGFFFDLLRAPGTTGAFRR